MIQGISKFKGIFVAFYACYDTEGNVDEKKIAKLANWYLDKGVNGLYLTGSSGEGMLLSEQERMRTVDAAMDAVGGKITVIAHVGAKNTQEACRLAAQAAKAGVDAVSSVPNIYYPLPEICIEEYWDALIDAARLPFIIYNIPSTTGYNLSLNLFEKMIRKPYVAGIKTTSPDSSLILKMKAIGGDNTVIFHGEDAQLLAGLSMGATGGIGGTYGAMPELYLNIYRAFTEGDMEKAYLWQQRATKALTHGRVSWTPGVASMKAILAARGMDPGGVRAPFKTVSANEAVVREAAEMIEEWIREGY
ncbi:MAG: dihydrodipicolinate synthase family protein [Christensenellales bacterium]|jgi:N-acetylneuraminate lyase|nr:dihydrodipicolinate synthase family protein [Clostridiales bacterium]